MTTYTVSNESEWVALNILDGDTITLAANITLTSQPTAIVIGAGTTVDGQTYTITRFHSGLSGIFELQGGTIKGLTIDGSGNDITSQHSLFLTNAYNQYGTFENCTATNATCNTYCSGFGGFLFGHATIQSSIRYCESSLTLADRCGGFLSIECRNTVIEYCKSSGADIGSGSFRGGILGYTNSAGGIDIRNTVVTKNCLGGGTCGGFMGTTNGGTNNITECIMEGDVQSGASGFLGRTESGSNGIINITDCYMSGNVTGSNAFGATPVISTLYSTLNLTRFYAAGSITGSFASALVNNNQGTYTVSGGIYIPFSLLTRYGSIPSGTVTNSLTGIDGTLPTGWVTSKWNVPGTVPNYIILQTFANESIWSGYTQYNSVPSLIQGASYSAGTLKVQPTKVGQQAFVASNTSVIGRVINMRPLGVANACVIKWPNGSRTAYFGKEYATLTKYEA